MSIQTEFLPDEKQLSRDKNIALIQVLSTDIHSYNIIKIERFNNSDNEHNSGWLITFLEND